MSISDSFFLRLMLLSFGGLVHLIAAPTDAGSTAQPAAPGESALASVKYPSGAGLPGSGVEGHWLGALHPTPAIELRIAVEIVSANPDKLDAFLISLDQGNARIPISVLSVKEGVVQFEAPRVKGSFDGRLTAHGSEIIGEWTQGMGALPLTLKRVAQAATVTRPQEPKPPYPYRAEEVQVRNKAAGVTLAGTLTLPSGKGPHPAVVLITGSGPQDRDEAVAGHRPFLVLADYLTRQGIAVLRCDDRGVGKSTGKFSEALDADFAEDALAGVAYLKSRSEIDGRKIGLVGHSEGGVSGPRAAVKSADVAFIVLLAGLGVPFDQVLERQSADLLRSKGASEALIARNTEAQRKIFAVLKTERDLDQLRPAVEKFLDDEIASFTPEEKKVLGATEAYKRAQMQMILSPWARDIAGYDPGPTLRAVKCPVLAICGEKDMQVSAKDNLPAIAAALAAGGNHRVKTAELPGLNHLLQACQTGSPAEYNRIDETMNPVALKLVGDWIRETTAF